MSTHYTFAFLYGWGMVLLLVNGVVDVAIIRHWRHAGDGLRSYASVSVPVVVTAACTPVFAFGASLAGYLVDEGLITVWLAMAVSCVGFAIHLLVCVGMMLAFWGRARGTRAEVTEMPEEVEV